MEIMQINYAEDFRKNEKAGKVYNLLRDNGFHPRQVITSYITKTGSVEATYFFKGVELPEKSKLIEMLKDVNIQNIKIKIK